MSTLQNTVSLVALIGGTVGASIGFSQGDGGVTGIPTQVLQGSFFAGCAVAVAWLARKEVRREEQRERERQEDREVERKRRENEDKVTERRLQIEEQRVQQVYSLIVKQADSWASNLSEFRDFRIEQRQAIAQLSKLAERIVALLERQEAAE